MKGTHRKPLLFMHYINLRKMNESSKYCVAFACSPAKTVTIRPTASYMIAMSLCRLLRADFISLH